MLEFLRITDDKQWDKKKAEFNKMKKPTKTCEILNTKGFVF